MSDHEPFFTAATLKNATMTELAEARAKVGFCPKCQQKRLQFIGRGCGMVFRGCAECCVTVVLPDAMP
jgi:hypothetical protein